MFFGRESEIEWLVERAEALKAGEDGSGALIGLPGIGKSSLLKEWMRVGGEEGLTFVYIDVRPLIVSPDFFTLQFLVRLLEQCGLLKKEWEESPEPLEGTLSNLARELEEPLRSKLLALLLNIRRGEKEHALEETLTIASVLAEKRSYGLMLLLDGAEELVNLRHYGLDPFPLLANASSRQEKVGYLLTFTAPTLAQELFGELHSLFFPFPTRTLLPLEREESSKAAADCWGNQPDECFHTLYKLTGGNPFYQKVVAEKAFCGLLKGGEKAISQNAVEKAFLEELFDDGGRLAVFFNHHLLRSLEKVQRKGTLKAPLQVLAEEEGLTLAEISRRLGKPSGQISNIMKSLLKTEIIEKVNNIFLFRDPLFRFWLEKKGSGRGNVPLFKGFTFFSVQEKEEEEEEKSYFDLRRFVRQNMGKEVGEVVMPHFEKITKNYLTTSGEVVSLFAENGESWAFEVKWSQKEAGFGELEAFVKKVDADGYLFVSRSGFTEEAVAFGEERGVIMFQG